MNCQPGKTNTENHQETRSGVEPRRATHTERDKTSQPRERRAACATFARRRKRANRDTGDAEKDARCGGIIRKDINASHAHERRDVIEDKLLRITTQTL